MRAKLRKENRNDPTSTTGVRYSRCDRCAVAVIDPYWNSTRTLSRTFSPNNREALPPEPSTPLFTATSK